MEESGVWSTFQWGLRNANGLKPHIYQTSKPPYPHIPHIKPFVKYQIYPQYGQSISISDIEKCLKIVQNCGKQ